MTFEVTILGANSARFAFGRHPTAQVVNHADRLFLLDCGEATQLQLARYRVRVSRIERIFITHLHGDHYLGLVGLLMTCQLSGRTQPLTIYGPPGLDEIITLQLRLSDTRLTYPTEFITVDAGPARIIYESEHLTVSTIPLEHRVPCNGYLLRERPHRRRMRPAFLEGQSLHPGQIAQLRRGEGVTLPDGQTITPEQATLPARPARAYAFVSDTIYKPDLVEQLDGMDLLYHEATFLHERLERAQQTFHTTARQAAQFARDAHAKCLLLGHYSSRYRSLEPLLDEARAVFAESRLALEGETLSLEYPPDGAEREGANGAARIAGRRAEDAPWAHGPQPEEAHAL